MTSRSVFSDYAVIPLDLPHPPVELARFRQFVQTYCEQCAFGDNVIRWILFRARKPIVDGSLLLHACDPRWDQLDGNTEFGWDPVFRAAFPHFVVWIELLPIERIHGIDLVTQTDHIPPHMDIFGENNALTYHRRFACIEPMYYRIILAEPEDASGRMCSFYVSREVDGPRHYVHLPPDTSAFAMSSSICYHGATFNRGCYKTTVVVYGDVDQESHLSLLARSLEKFAEYAIRFDGGGPASGPGAAPRYAGPVLDSKLVKP